jgi:hypothetical protein
MEAGAGAVPRQCSAEVAGKPNTLTSFHPARVVDEHRLEFIFIAHVLETFAVTIVFRQVVRSGWLEGKSDRRCIPTLAL